MTRKKPLKRKKTALKKQKSRQRKPRMEMDKFCHLRKRQSKMLRKLRRQSAKLRNLKSLAIQERVMNGQVMLIVKEISYGV